MKRKFVEEGLSAAQIAAVAGVSKSCIKARLRALGALAEERRREGYLLGQIPFGWKKEHGQMVPHVAEQRILATIRALRKRGQSLRAIAEQLNTHGVRSKNGDRWHAESVRRALRAKPPEEKKFQTNSHQ